MSKMAIIEHHNSGAEVVVVTIFHIWSHAELMTLISGTHLETVVILFTSKTSLQILHKSGQT